MKRKEAEQIVIQAAMGMLQRMPDERLEMALAIVTNELDASDFHDKDAGEFGRCPF